jgi:hypothetical protein
MPPLLLLLNDGDPATAHVDEAIAAARRPNAGCERSVKLLLNPSEGAGPLGEDPCFDFREAPVVLPVPVAVASSSSAQQEQEQEQQQQSRRSPPRKLTELLEQSQTQSSLPPLSPSAATATDGTDEQPLSPLFGPAISTSTLGLGRLEPPPPLVLPAPPAFDRAPLPSSSSAQPQAQPQLQQPQQPQQPQQSRRLTLATIVTEDLTLTFSGAGSGSEVRVSLEGHVQLGITATSASFSSTSHMTGEGKDLDPPLEVDVALSDRGGQIGLTTPHPSVAVTDKPPLPTSSIPESTSTTAVAEPPASSSSFSSSYRCRIPPSSSSSSFSLQQPQRPLTLLRYEAKPSVRPIPVRLQQSLVRVEEGVAHVVAQVRVCGWRVFVVSLFCCFLVSVALFFDCLLLIGRGDVPPPSFARITNRAPSHTHTHAYSTPNPPQVVVNPALFMPLVGASLSLHLCVPGLELGQVGCARK